MFDLFAHRSPQYTRNSHNTRGDDLPCVLCGKAVSDPPKYQVHLHQGGAFLVTEEEAQMLHEKERGRNSFSDMGFYPVGVECYRRNPAIRPYVTEFAREK